MIKRFQECVRQSFDPVADQYGMKCIESSATYIGYDNGTVALAIMERWDEIAIIVSFVTPRAGYATSGCSFSGYLEALGAPEAGFVENLEARDETTLPRKLEILAQLLASVGGSLLAGDVEQFDLVGRYDDLQSVEYGKEQAIVATRNSADVAWQHQDYVSVARLYDSMEESLLPAERTRRQIAAEKILTMPIEGPPVVGER